MTLDEAFSVLETMVNENGEPVKVHSAECVVWLMEHNQLCYDCPHYLPCEKYAQIVTIYVKFFEKPFLSDRERNLALTYLILKINKILLAKTINDIHKVVIDNSL